MFDVLSMFCIVTCAYSVLLAEPAVQPLLRPYPYRYSGYATDCTSVDIVQEMFLADMQDQFLGLYATTRSIPTATSLIHSHTLPSIFTHSSLHLHQTTELYRFRLVSPTGSGAHMYKGPQRLAPPRGAYGLLSMLLSGAHKRRKDWRRYAINSHVIVHYVYTRSVQPDFSDQENFGVKVFVHAVRVSYRGRESQLPTATWFLMFILMVACGYKQMNFHKKY